MRMTTLDLTVLHDRSSPEFKAPAIMSAKDCLSCLAACERWDAPSLRAIVLEIVANSRQSARIVAARRYGKQDWLMPALIAFCSTPVSELEVADFEILDPDDLLKISKVREQKALNSYRGGGNVEQMIADVFQMK
jgi:hypothetical protein